MLVNRGAQFGFLFLGALELEASASTDRRVADRNVHRSAGNSTASRERSDYRNAVVDPVAPVIFDLSKGIFADLSREFRQILT